jgi:hypothetical protein
MCGSRVSLRVSTASVLQHLVNPGPQGALGPYHFVVFFHVDGENVTIEVIGVGGGTGFHPYPGNSFALDDPSP